MGVAFTETLRGELRDRRGRSCPIRFDITAEASDTRAFARTGRARLTGVVRVDPWVPNGVVDGTITLRPLWGRSIHYAVEFSDEQQRAYRFEGAKSLSWLRPVRSATWLKGTLWRGQEELAHGVLRFDVRELGSFGKSWLARPATRRLDLGRGDIGGGSTQTVLGPRRRAILGAFADGCLVPGAHLPGADAQTLADALGVVGHLPGPLRAAYGVALDGVDLMSRARTGHGIVSLSTPQRRALIQDISDSSVPAQTTLLGALAMPVKAAQFSRRDYLDSAGVPTFEHSVREPPAPWMQAVVAPEELDLATELEADVVVVGTGAGGAALAATLAEQGVVVAMVEAGRFVGREAFSGPPLERSLRLWSHRGMQFSVGNCVASIPTGRVVGGTTTINSGTCFHTPDAVLRAWRGEGLPEDFEPEAFAPYLRRVDEELRVQPGDPRVLGRVAQTVARGADAMGFGHGALPRNAEGCDGQGTCVVGCPTDAKRSANISWVPRALKAGASLFTGMRVQRVLMRGRRAVGVVARGQDRGGRSVTLTLRAKAVVLATGSLVTPVILRDHGFASPSLGRNLSIHPGFGLYARMPGLGTPWHAIPQGYGMHGHGLEGVRFEGFYLPPQLSGVTLPAVGRELTRWMDEPGEVDQFGFMVRDRGNGRLLRTRSGGTVVRYDLDERSVRRLQQGASLLAEVLLRGGAVEVHTCIRGVGSVRTVQEARQVATRRLRARDFTVLGAHPLGTARMAANPARGVVDPEHRVYGTENLYIADGSAVPTSLGVNPQVTIMAMAIRAGERLAARL